MVNVAFLQLMRPKCHLKCESFVICSASLLSGHSKSDSVLFINKQELLVLPEIIMGLRHCDCKHGDFTSGISEFPSDC